MERIEALEVRVAHLMRSVEDLSDVVARQADEIDRMARRMALLMAREAERPAEPGAAPADERPPHW